MRNYNKQAIINVGTGEDITISELAYLIKNIVGYSGEIIFDISKPDGMPRKLLEVSKLSGLGWQAKTRLRDGIAKTYDWYIRHSENVHYDEKNRS